MKKISLMFWVCIALLTTQCSKKDPQDRTSTIPVSGVSLNKKSLSLTIGGTETLTATILPDNAADKSVTWKSSNTTVATVDANGKIAAVTAGSATITVTTTDNHKSATCAVTVASTNANIAVTGVNLNHYSLSLNDADLNDVGRLIATIAPEKASNKVVTWTNSNPDIATLDEYGNVYARKLGTTEITVTTADGNKKATCKVDVTAWGTIPVGAGYLDLKWWLSLSGELSFSQGIAIPNFGENTAPWHKYRQYIKKARISGVKNIGHYAFYRCTALTDVSFETVNGVSTEDIGNYVFSGCAALKNVTLASTVKTIGLESFSGCTALQVIGMPAAGALTTIGDWAFANCVSLQRLYIPNSTKRIGIGSFNNCNQLISASLGSGLTSIGDDAFRFCPALKNVSCDVEFPVPVLGARNFDAVGDYLRVSYEASNYFRPNPAWRAAFDGNIGWL